MLLQEDVGTRIGSSAQSIGRWVSTFQRLGTQVAQMLERRHAWPHFQHLQDTEELRDELQAFIKDTRLPPKMVPSISALQLANRQDLINAIRQAGENH